MRENSFIFKGYKWDAQTGEAKFTYALQYQQELFTFTENLTFPHPATIHKVPQELLEIICNNVLLALGVSYYKLYCPKQIVLETFSLNESQANFWNTVYTKGLGEFFYKNKIDFRELISFPVSKDVVTSPIAFPRQKRALVGIGGGKDSIVAGELLKSHQKPFTAFVVNTHPVKEKSVELLGVDEIVVKRELDTRLFELNKREDTYNGHVPVSAQLAFIGVLTAILYDYSSVIMANEASANYGNVSYLGEMMNHQWSKSVEFEELFQQYVVDTITTDVEYFSLLRPFSELKIMELFSKHPQYFPIFSSCNRNFTVTKTMEGLWCGKCPKCAFTFIMLAAFLSAEQVITIFGKNLLDDESLLKTYKELLGLEAIKPFDCVGTPEEVRTAFYLIRQRAAFNNSPVMQWFEKTVVFKIAFNESLKVQLLTPSSEHHIPEAFQEVLK